MALESVGYMALCMEAQYEVVGFIPLAFVRDDPLGGTIKTNPTLSGRGASIRVLGTIWSKFPD